MIPNHRDALFLRMAELLGGYAPFLFDEGQRRALNAGWCEIAPSVAYEIRTIREEEAE